MTEYPEKQPAIDEIWHSQFEKNGMVEAYEYLEGYKNHREEQKRLFLSGEVRNPILDYPRLDPDDLKGREEALLSLKEEILAKEENEIVGQAYRWKINESVAKLRMLQASISGDMRRFKRYSEFIYGKPSYEIFVFTVQSLRTKINEYRNSDNRPLSRAARELDEVLPQETERAGFVSLPSEGTISLAERETAKAIGDLVHLPEVEGELGVDEIKDIFQKALDSLNLDEWEVVTDISGKPGASVDQEEKKIKIPESKKLLFKEVQSLLVHEIGTHVARREKGERSRLRLLGPGLDRYERGEEGIATMRSQIVSGQIEDFSGLTGHLAISLAYGLDGKPRDFRDVYEIMQKYYFFDRLVKGKNIQKAKEEAQRLAWNKGIRTFRGTDYTTPGVCFTKDIIYREGNIGVWELIGKKPNEFRRITVGKYDPTNPRHLYILDQLGISES
ncbi:MAG TPA: tyrosine/phenylalanine carboxypeptidase domain-containing protein [Patescibacteria group bacterium]|nr:tyrosine/phenylalanine carboxypeptidase domain-containing protein [Patescibacteria group bacterium]